MSIRAGFGGGELTGSPHRRSAAVAGQREESSRREIRGADDQAKAIGVLNDLQERE